MSCSREPCSFDYGVDYGVEHNRRLRKPLYSQSFLLYKSDRKARLRSNAIHTADDTRIDRLGLSNKILPATLEYVNTFFFPQHRIV